MWFLLPTADVESEAAASQMFSGEDIQEAIPQQQSTSLEKQSEIRLFYSENER